MNGNLDGANGSNLLDSVKNAITPDLMNRLGTVLGASPEQSKGGLLSAIPVVIASLIRKGSSESGAQSILNMIKQLGFGPGSSSEATNTLFRGLAGGQPQAMNSVQGVMTNLYGDKLGPIIQTLTQVTGMSGSLVSKLMSFATPFVLSILSHKAVAGGFNSSWLTHFLGAQRSSVLAALPVGFGAHLAPETTYHTETDAVASQAVGAPAKRAPRWIIPAAIAALVLGGAWLYRRARTNEQPTSAPVAATTTDSLEPVNELNRALSSDTAAPKNVVFHEMTFDFSTSNLTPEGRAAVNALSESLKAHPAASVRLEGHTDGVGDAATNKALSLERANAVKNILVRSGVSPSHVEVAGLGDEQPIASNTTDEGRARNRRIEVVVLTKNSEGVAH